MLLRIRQRRCQKQQQQQSASALLVSNPYYSELSRGVGRAILAIAETQPIYGNLSILLATSLVAFVAVTFTVFARHLFDFKHGVLYPSRTDTSN